MSKPLMYRENKCKFPCTTLILAIETWITDSETKPCVCLRLLFPFLCSYLLTNYIIWGWILPLFWTTSKSQHKEELIYECTEKCHKVSSLVSCGRGKNQHRAANTQHKIFPLQWNQIKGSRQFWKRTSLKILFDYGGWFSRPAICNSNNKCKQCMLIAL